MSKTNLRIPGHRVLIKPINVTDDINSDLPEDLRNKGFIISVGDKRTQLMYQHGVERGTVVQVGEMAWKSPDLGWGTPDWKPWCEVGDEVIFVKYSGRPTVDPVTGEEFLVINDVDLHAVVNRE